MKRSLSRLLRFTHTPIESLGGAAFVIAFMGIGSRILGFIRDRLLASSFGAGDLLDVYYAAFRLPDLVYGLLVLGALSAAFIPVFTGYWTRNDRETAWGVARGIMTLLLLTLGGLSLIGILIAPWLATWLAPGFSPEKQTLVATLTRIMLLSPLLLGASAVFGGILVSFKQFLAYSLSPIFYNIGIIVGIVWLYPIMGPVGLAWGVVLGSFLHLLVQYPAVRKSGFRFVLPHLSLYKVGLRRVIRLMIPRSLAVAVNQVSLLIVTIFASTLVSGSLAAFTLATNIQSVPLGLFGIAFSLAAFPALAALAAKNDHAQFFRTLVETSLRILYFVLPLSAFIIIFRAEMIRVILGSGAFNWEDTITTFQVLGFLSLSLFAQSLAPLFVRAFFALENTRLPLYAALISEIVHLALIPILLPHYQVVGLAIAFSLGAITNFFLLYFFLRPRVPTWKDARIALPALKIFLATIAAGLVAQYSKTIFALAIDRLDTFAEVFMKLSLGLAIGMSTYILLSIWLKFPEFENVKRFVWCRLLRQPETSVSTADHPEQGDW